MTNQMIQTPKEIVSALDQFIVGQGEAKRAVAIALRNRWRRMQLKEELRREITPKNILMMGPTGVGKTEIARRLAQLAGAPFIKVEATKFTEVGYVGRDVESIIRDLVEIAVKRGRDQALTEVRQRARVIAEERILDTLLPDAPPQAPGALALDDKEEKPVAGQVARNLFRDKLRAGELNDKEIELNVLEGPFGMEIMGPPGMEEMTQQLQGMFESVAKRGTKKRRMSIEQALKLLTDEEAQKLIDEDGVKNKAVHDTEQLGIVFIDEIDKVVRPSRAATSGEISREGVQRDLLPLVEGSTVLTKYGPVKTDYMLFIASGAFQVSRPSDLIPELQGRFPIRVELGALGVDDFVRILTEPNASLTEQYTALLSTERVQLEFDKTGVKRLAELAYKVNSETENIGARRLHTLMERLLEQVSFDASDRAGDTVMVTATYVNNMLQKLVDDEDLSRYIL